MTKRGRILMKGIERADSVTIDGHKSFFLHFGIGCLLVRDGKNLVDTFGTDTTHQSYVTSLRDIQDDVTYDFAELNPEQTRPFRALSMWLPLRLHGSQSFALTLEEKLLQCEVLGREIEKIEKCDSGFVDCDGVTWRIRIVTPPTLTILTFGLLIDGDDPKKDLGGVSDGQRESEEEDRRRRRSQERGKEVNRRFLECIHKSGEVWLVFLPLRGRHVIRVNTLSHRSRWDDIRNLLLRIGEALEILKSESRGTME